jgi:hypothetical protein
MRRYGTARGRRVVFEAFVKGLFVVDISFGCFAKITVVIVIHKNASF